MPLEIEQKFVLRDAEALRARLREAGARLCSSVLELNTIYDDERHSLRTAGCGLRLRTETGDDGSVRHTLTFKGPLASDALLRQREEIESVIGNRNALEAILAQLGYRPRLRFEKRRETWALAGLAVGATDKSSDRASPERVLVMIDEMPGCGRFAEIEAGSTEAVQRAARLLGMTESDAEPRTYVAMTAEFGTIGADGVRSLAF